MGTTMAEGKEVASTSAVMGHAATELEALLGGLLAATTAAFEGVRAQREAIGRADHARLGRAVASSEQAAAELSRLDRVRREFVSKLTSQAPGVAAGGEVVTLTRVNEWLSGAGGSSVVQGRLRGERIEQVRALGAALRQEAASTRVAAAALCWHIEGVVRQVGHKLSHSGTYGRRGVVESREAVVSSLDVRS